MKYKNTILKTILTVTLALTLSVLPIYAADDITSSYSNISPRYNNIIIARIDITFDANNVIECSLEVDPLSHCSGVSGLMKLFDSNGTCLTAWSVSDYEEPLEAKFYYQGTRGETYTANFVGYAYSNNQTAPDRLDISDTGTCNG